MKSMKTAILFSGSIRDFRTCVPSLKRYLLNNLNADIFLHLWKMNDVPPTNLDIRFKWRTDLCDENFVLDILKPTRYVIDTYSSDWEKTIINESSVDLSKFTDSTLKNYGVNACGMYYKIYKAFSIMENYCEENSFKYDLVVRARLDFIWEDHVKLENFHNIDDKSIYLMKDRYASHSRLNTNDKYFAGSFDAMKKVCNLFNCISNYQKAGIMVEGQKLIETHIRCLGLQVKWIGHPHTYYKCMGRHSIKKSNKTIIINNDSKMASFWYELSYELLYGGYNVIYKNIESNHEIDILKLFANFKFYSDGMNLDIILCHIGSFVEKDLNSNQIIINSLDNICGDDIDNKKITNITTTENISINSLKDFVISIIRTGKYGTKYCFTKSTIIYNVVPNESVIYKYMDHGYYTSNIRSYDPKTKFYIISIDKKLQKKNSRKSFKIIDLIKYCDRLESNCMPANDE